MNEKLLKEANSLKNYLNEIFFKIHKNPELSTQEYKTQALILEELEKMGIEAKKIADTGVLGIIRGKNPGKTVALRADMDALPIEEETDLIYKSKNKGVMHACGHDAHTTILLGAAKILSSRKDSLNGNVKLFFQPAEETIGGALRMIEEGCMENPNVDAVFFGHVSLSPTGVIALKSGPTSADSNPFTLKFKGKGTHGCAPHNGSDVIVAACQTVLALQTICSRRTSPTDSIVVSIGKFNAGTISNVLPETAEVSGIMRTLNPTTRARAKEDLKQIVLGTASAMGVDVEIDMKDGYSSTHNDVEMTNVVINSAKKVLGENSVRILESASMGLEDVGYFFKKSRGCYYNLGAANVEKGYTYPTHSPKFAVDPDAIINGTALYVQIAEDFLNN